MRIVPSIIVYNHSGYLISVIPPAHYSSVSWSILCKPIISFAEVIKNTAATVMSVGSKNNRWTGVCIASDPSAVNRKHH
ncbi:Protein of unknown function [Cotesia congregata]|uniref:Uncharacterized protein n=1 Tax=Cotesia congregata TaxID=51543 RepID=A0A8J2HMJ8_COTCN|nr:Protein of unknown function [Cotesia congregata]